MTAPTIVTRALLSSTWATTTTPKTTSLTVQVGDTIVVSAVAEGNDATLTTPTGLTGATWVLQKSDANASRCKAYLWTADVTTAGTITLSVTRTGTALRWSARVWQIRGSGGIGASSVVTAGFSTNSLTTTGPDSLILATLTDWSAATGTASWTAISGSTETSPDDYGDTSYYGVHTHEWLGVGAAGSKAVRTSWSGSSLALLSIEVRGVASGDVTAPTVPTGLVSSLVTPSSFTVSWNASTDAVGVTGYEVYLGGVSQGTTASLSWAFSGLSENTAYSVQVRAGDAAGNWSALSSALSVTTLNYTLGKRVYVSGTWYDVSHNRKVWTGLAWA